MTCIRTHHLAVTSCQSVALAFIVCPVTTSRGSTACRPAAPALLCLHCASVSPTSRRSVALALTVRLVTPPRGSTTPCASARLVVRSHWLYFSQSWVATTCLTATPTLLQVRRMPPRHGLLAASCQPLISTSFPN
jgi:hypothetical protein